MQAACGRVLRAIATISSVAAISRFSGLVMLRLEPGDVVIADMAAILAQMRRDPVGAGGDRNLRRPQRIRMIAPARIAHRRHVIDVDAKPNGKNRSHRPPRRTGLAVHPLGASHHGLGAQLRDDRGEVFEVINLKVDGQVAEVGRFPLHADVVDVAVVLGDDLGDLCE